ncbi:MAG TPA: DNA/RNA non-specific endonuclease [Cytophaga sp.]|jgi:endonuclease G|nr:DNA/RNA non-specific endonuclease [Cytophaga sp.]
MKKILIIAMLMPLFCIAQAPTDTVSLNEGNFHTAWSHSAKYPVKVYWHLTADMLDCVNPNVRNERDFGPDPQLPNETQLNSDYAKSGYDRGHNFDAADSKCSNPEIYLHCWYFTNIAPQTPHLNRITWKALEAQCRKWAKAGDDLFIECGSYGKSKTIGPDNVGVPEFCWKIVKHKSGEIDSFLMPNTSDVNQYPFTYYRTDISVIEQKTGLANL